MLTRAESAAALAVLESFLESAGKDLHAQHPLHYLLLSSAQLKLREQVRVRPQTSDVS